MQASTINILKYGYPRRPSDPLAWKRARSNPHRHMGMVSRFIRALRGRLSLTQEAFAARVGVIPITVSRWERKNGMMPRKYQWRRLRELWEFTKKITGDEGFMRNRTRKVEF
jgi:DNA-binding XRE family transcriptional regulator